MQRPRRLSVCSATDSLYHLLDDTQELLRVEGLVQTDVVDPIGEGSTRTEHDALPQLRRMLDDCVVDPHPILETIAVDCSSAAPR